MNKDALYAEIADYLATAFEVPRELITPDADLVEKLNLDSIDAIDLMVRLQEITGRKVEPEEFKSVRTINDVLILAQGANAKG
ncbi:MAG TPA: acyl carrier protein [Caulobacterales bacterium]|nr:acyl carrier protein [Caulobacterales bacterium]